MSSAAPTVVDRQLLRDVWEGRRGLPAEAFVDEQWFAAEVASLVTPHWMCIALEDDVARPG